jgi:hypothetical protein
MRSFAAAATAAAVLITPAALITPSILIAPSAASAAAAGPVLRGRTAAPKYDEELAITGKANHRRPVPGETQTVRWVLRNLGALTIQSARLETAVPRGWVLKEAPGCERAGRALHCERGPLRPGARATIRLRMAVPRHPKLGRVWVWASTRFQASGPDRRGPDAVLRLFVVRHR